MKIVLASLLLAVVLNGSSWFLLGNSSKNKDIVNSNNSIFWKLDNSQWSVSEPTNNLNLSNISKKGIGYVLINNDKKDYTTTKHYRKSYELKKGWNYLNSSVDGVDVIRTFSSTKDISFVYVYEKRSSVWAGYSPDNNLMKKILSTRILSLKYIEPGLGFYVYAKNDVKIDIKSTVISATCQKKIDSDEFGVVYDTGTSKDIVFNDDKSIGVGSRYLSHHKRGIYNDTRVALIYPKIDKLHSEKQILKYGPAVPKVKIRFNKAYEAMTYYIYDYNTRVCYEGILPSAKIPPYSVLKKLD